MRWVLGQGSLTLGWFHVAVAVGIANVSRTAYTGGQVVGDTAVRIGATGAGAGVATLLLLARLVRGAVRVADAFRATRLIRIAEVVGQALAGADAVPLPANSIGAAGIGFAGGHLLVNYAF